jgi:hypothetical protein
VIGRGLLVRRAVLGRGPVLVAEEAPRTALEERRAAGELPSAAGALGALPAISVVAAVGVFLVALADSGSRDGARWSPSLFWLGVLLVITPVAARLLTAAAARRERLGLVVLLGSALYLLKVAYSPVALVIPDELIHLFNVNEVLRNQHLFTPNSLLPATAFYPGLASVTAALVSLTGLTPPQAGLVVIGAGRLVLMLALFLLIEQVSRSSRVAGIAAALYCANPNFLLFDADFAYESLALPLAAMVLFLAARRADARTAREGIGLTVVALLALFAVIVTHHLTAYVLVLALWAAVVLALVRGRKSLLEVGGSPIDLALVGSVAVVVWLGLVANSTVGYLSPVLGGAVDAAGGVIGGQGAVRLLFQATTGSAAPLGEQLLGFGSVVLIVLGLPFGLYQLRQERRRASAFALLLALAALAWLPVQGLRFTQAGWETANRSSEFLFIGLGFVLAIALVARASSRLAIGLGAAYLTAVFLGGVATAWRPDVRLPRPFLLAASNGALVEPAGVTVARWTRDVLGRGQSIATDPTNAELLLAYAEQRPATTAAHGIRAMLYSATVDDSTREILAYAQARYVLVDRRLNSWDHLIGVYPRGGLGDAADPPRLFDPSVYGKFDTQPTVSRLLDAGDIVLYDVEALSSGASAN